MRLEVTAEDIVRAVTLLRAGGLVAFPTETVYGLGADASNAEAVKKIFAAKGRPHDHPLIVHIADVAQLSHWAHDIPPAAQTLARKFWPGPLTIILKRAPAVSDLVTGGQDTVAIRVPSHPVAQALLLAFGGGVVGPSANRFGRVSATTAEHVHQEFGDSIDCVLDGGACDVGIESTIVDLSSAKPALLRPGCITAAQIETALGPSGASLAAPDAQSPRAPGTLAKHYAPRTPLMLVESDLIDELARSFARQGKRIAVLVHSARQPMIEQLVWIAAPAAPAGYAHDLYANLRRLDAAACDVLLVEALPLSAEWAAVRDRIGRAAAGSGTAENG
ncbi:MAG TPA: L-threonylcarbamoyladenylate synthase [Burkholderiales bacterium]|nr:L-threonylcarbamoyladenylate synthase [Burkholderiales bacterium]